MDPEEPNPYQLSPALIRAMQEESMKRRGNQRDGSLYDLVTGQDMYGRYIASMRNPGDYFFGSPEEARQMMEQRDQEIASAKRALSQAQREASALQAETAQHKELLTKARDAIAELKEEVEKLSAPPNAMGIFEKWDDYESGVAYVMVRGERHRVTFGMVVEGEEDTFTKDDEAKSALRAGFQVILNDAMNIVDYDDEETVGEVVTFSAYLDGSRALVSSQADSAMVVNIATGLEDSCKLREGDKLLMNRARFVYEVVPKTESQSLLLEKVPDISYESIGGLAKQVGMIRDAIELPILQADLFKVYGLEAPKGVLLYGPPGCGKTLIAKAVANSLAKQTGGNAFFVNIKGPELLNKWVGETERSIRDIFEQARAKADDGHVVVVFFDEMESLFRQRGAGVSSDMESTVVPQLLAEIDGVEEQRNVIVIGASNRPDLIDPAVLRPGRLDIKIQVERPDAEGAADIFGIYLNPSVPINEEEREGDEGEQLVLDRMIGMLINRIYAESTENEFLEVTYVKGDVEKLYFKDFMSGAMIANLVRRAKRIAIKEELATGARGVRLDHLMVAANEEFRENEDLPNTTNPDDWARISGRKGEKIAGVRSIVQERGRHAGTSISTATTTGQYL